MNTEHLAQAIEAILFAEGVPVTFKKLIAELNCDEHTLKAALDHLTSLLASRGVVLVRTDKEAALAVSSTCAPIVAAMTAREVERDIGDAGLEVLGILLYKGPSTRSRIDYIRGVNSSSTIRNLLARGLIERAPNPSDAREFLYRPTADTLAYLGVTTKEELPEYATIADELAAFESAGQTQDATGDTTGREPGEFQAGEQD